MEDTHMFHGGAAFAEESALTKRIGQPGRKLHTG